ncbi:MAG: DNA repair protein RadC [Synergistales bacterium]|nr:DNA repair protein RadC [Synergistales bacterium]
MSSFKDLPAEERPRERLFGQGPGALSVSEVIAILLNTGGAGRDVLDLAGEVLREFGGIQGLARATPKELRSIKGVGKAKAAYLAAALELARRYLTAKREEQATLPGWEQEIREWSVQYAAAEREYILSLFLDSRKRVLGREVLSHGGLDGAFLDLPYLLRRAVRLGAEAMILAHNHPDGASRPSRDDITLTVNVARKLAVLDIKLVDHFILAGGEMYPVPRHLWDESEGMTC